MRMKWKAQEFFAASPSAHADRCVFEIIRQIREGALRPGQRLGEESIARQLGMGRAPVRVAFERLVATGVLERIHRAGTFVRQVGLEEFCELMDVRALLEGAAARLACARATRAQLSQLMRRAHRMDRLQARLQTGAGFRASDWVQMQQLETDFHGCIVTLSGNRMLARIFSMQGLIAHCFQMGVSLPLQPLPRPTRPAVPQHRQIVRALSTRNPGIAEKTMRDHILRSKQRQVQALTAKC